MDAGDPCGLYPSGNNGGAVWTHHERHDIYHPLKSQRESAVGQFAARVDPSKAVATELLSTNRLPFAAGGWAVTVGAESVVLVRIEAGPKFARIEPAPAGQLRLTIEAPADLEHVLETSSNLASWAPIKTNPPQSDPFTKEETLSAEDPEGYFRLRW